MTAASRVSDSRVTDEMVREWAERHDIFNSGSGGHLTDACAAFDDAQSLSALACQGPVVTVSDLEELRDEIRSQASLKDHYAEWEETERMFAALIAKANGHE